MPKERVFKIRRVFYLLIYEGGFWFRFFKGYGLSCKNIRIHGRTFSERNGFIKTLEIGKWSFKILK